MKSNVAISRIGRAIILAVWLLPLVAGAGILDIRINEVMANNTSTRLSGVLTNYDSAAYPDWVEFYNSGITPVDMYGLILTNWGTLTNGLIFRFPSYTLQPGAYVVVIYDLEPSAPGEFHTGFGLERNKGERVVLLTPARWWRLIR